MSQTIYSTWSNSGLEIWSSGVVESWPRNDVKSAEILMRFRSSKRTFRSLKMTWKSRNLWFFAILLDSRFDVLTQYRRSLDLLLLTFWGQETTWFRMWKVVRPWQTFRWKSGENPDKNCPPSSQNFRPLPLFTFLHRSPQTSLLSPKDVKWRDENGANLTKGTII